MEKRRVFGDIPAPVALLLGEATCGKSTIATVSKSGFSTTSVEVPISCDRDEYFIETPITLSR